MEWQDASDQCTDECTSMIFDECSKDIMEEQIEKEMAKLQRFKRGETKRLEISRAEGHNALGF